MKKEKIKSDIVEKGSYFTMSIVLTPEERQTLFDFWKDNLSLAGTIRDTSISRFFKDYLLKCVTNQIKFK